MKRIGHRTDQHPRWILYHGTSSTRLERILSENRLRVSPTGPDRELSLTTKLPAAQYFACNAVFGDHHFRKDETSRPRVLALDG